jgi:hypothetical protein
LVLVAREGQAFRVQKAQTRHFQPSRQLVAALAAEPMALLPVALEVLVAEEFLTRLLAAPVIHPQQVQWHKEALAAQALLLAANMAQVVVVGPLMLVPTGQHQ